MQGALNAIQWIARVIGLIQIILGLAFWTGNLDNLVPIHMLIGLIIVILLWIVAVMAFRAGVPPALPAVAIIWGILTVWLGLTQDQLLPGGMHWLIQVIHLLVGLGALGQIEAMIMRMKRGRTAMLGA